MNSQIPEQQVADINIPNEKNEVTDEPGTDAYTGTGNNKYLGMHGRPLGLAVSVVATTGFLLFGYDQGVMSGIISADPFNNYFPETKDDSVYRGFVTAIYEIGCLAGALFALGFGDNLGRRKMVSTLNSIL